MKRIIRTLLLTVVFLLVVVGLAVLFVVRPFALVFSDRKSMVEADPAGLRQHVGKLSREFVPRDYSHPSNLDKTASYIHDQFRIYNDQVKFQDVPVGDRNFLNVISEYRKNDGAQVVVGAHYDAFGPFPGADDNASGVAGLLELARLLSVRPVSVPVSLVAFTLEEPPFFAGDAMGSAVHAKSLKDAKVPVKLMISLEMIGYYSEEEGSQMYPLPVLSYLYPSRGNFIAIVDKLNLNLHTVAIKRSFRKCAGIPAVSINAPRFLPGIDLSDHRNYWSNGFNAVMITDTAFMRNLAYHTKADRSDRLDYEKMGEVIKGLYCYLESLG